MKISKKSQYGLRAMVYLASVYQKKNPRPLKEISKKENISFDYLEKILFELEKAGLIKAKKGARGGYFLSRRPQKIRVGEIVRGLEGSMAPVLCVAREKDKKIYCPRKNKCKSFFVWQRVQDVLNSALNSITLADLIKK